MIKLYQKSLEQQQLRQHRGAGMKATNINWDVTDGAEDMTEEEIQEVLSTLPTEIEIPLYIADSVENDDIEEIISDWLSDTYGFCHNGFDIVQ